MVNFYQTAVSIKISNLLICFSSFLSCPILEKDNFIEIAFFVSIFIMVICHRTW